MTEQEITALLNNYKEGYISTEEVILKLKREPFKDMGFAKLDLHRGLRNGVPEVIYGEGKEPKQIIQIISELKKTNQRVMITRLNMSAAEIIEKSEKIKYFKDARIGLAGDLPEPDSRGTIVIATGGTSDIPVAEEAAVTAEILGNRVKRLYDVGVAGIHRLLAHTELLMNAQVVIAVAGMEGALASVIGGLVSCPVIAVPTSVGYGSAFSGLAPLLSMLNSCSSGVSVVNIDNGFGAAYQASIINHIGV